MKELISFLRWSNYDDPISEIKDLVQVYTLKRRNALAAAESGEPKATSELDNITNFFMAQREAFTGKDIDSIDVNNEKRALT